MAVIMTPCSSVPCDSHWPTCSMSRWNLALMDHQNMPQRAQTSDQHYKYVAEWCRIYFVITYNTFHVNFYLFSKSCFSNAFFSSPVNVYLVLCMWPILSNTTSDINCPEHYRFVWHGSAVNKIITHQCSISISRSSSSWSLQSIHTEKTLSNWINNVIVSNMWCILGI